MWLRSLLVVAASLSGAATLLALPANATGVGGQASFAVKPVLYDPALPATKSYFIVQAKPGEVIQDRVTVVNTGTRAGTAYLYAVDATTGKTSGAVYLARRSPRRDVGRWTRLARTQVTLDPGVTTVVSFAIRVPAGARPGDHLGGIVAENAAIQKGAGKGALQIRIRHLTIAAVEVQVPGRIVSRVDVTGVKAGGQQGWQYVYLHLLNPGTVMVKPRAQVVIRNAHGRRVATRSLLLDTFVPGTAIDYPVLLPHKTLAPGRYTARVTLASSNQAIAGYRKTPPPPFSNTRRFAFTVSSGDRKQVFSGVAPVTAPPPAVRPKAKDEGRRKALFGVGLAAVALLVLILLALHVARERRAARRGPDPDSDAETATMLAATAPRIESPTPPAEAAPAAVLPPFVPPPPVADELENLPGAALGFALLLTAAGYATRPREHGA